jgi:hypothetical protein
MFKATILELHQKMKALVVQSGISEESYDKLIDNIEDELAFIQELAAVEEVVWRDADQAYRSVTPSMWAYYDLAGIRGQAEQEILADRLRTLKIVFNQRMKPWLKKSPS